MQPLSSVRTLCRAAARRLQETSKRKPTTTTTTTKQKEFKIRVLTNNWKLLCFFFWILKHFITSSKWKRKRETLLVFDTSLDLIDQTYQHLQTWNRMALSFYFLNFRAYVSVLQCLFYVIFFVAVKRSEFYGEQTQKQKSARLYVVFFFSLLAVATGTYCSISCLNSGLSQVTHTHTQKKNALKHVSVLCFVWFFLPTIHFTGFDHSSLSLG